MPVFAFSACSQQGKISVTITDDQNKPVQGVEIVFKKGNTVSGKIITNEKGLAKMAIPFNSDDKSVMIIAYKDGFATMSAKCPCDDVIYTIRGKGISNVDAKIIIGTAAAIGLGYLLFKITE